MTDRERFLQEARGIFDYISPIARRIRQEVAAWAYDRLTASQWISVEDRLPERLEWVLAYCAEGNGRPGEYGVAMRDREGDGWHDGYGHWFMTPTHWSLLQEPARKK